MMPNIAGSRDDSFFYDDDDVFNIRIRNQKNAKKIFDSYIALSLIHI